MSAKKVFGPDFLEAGSRLYRAEYAALSVAVVGYLVWRGLSLEEVNVVQTLFWVVFPDLVAFVPIGVSGNRGEWPSWGAYVYDAVHNLITWGLVFAAAWFVLGVPSWPIFGWLAHITVDRTMGYGLRQTRRRKQS